MPQESLPLKHYYHVYADGEWKVPVAQHIKALKESGLYGVLSELKIGIVGKNSEPIKEFLYSNNIKYELIAETDEGWEQETQDKLYFDAINSEPFKVLYAHTKGAANVSPVNTAWRGIMTKTVVCRWQEAVELLNDYDAVGALWLRDWNSRTSYGPSIGERGFFAGTFWWANSQYIASLGYPRRGCRWDSESWVGETGRVVDTTGTTRFMKVLPNKDLKIYDMYESIPNLLAHFKEVARKGAK